VKQLLALIALSLTGVSVYGQTPTATLSGTVRDTSGAVVPNAKITLTNSGTGPSRTTATDDEGRYSLTDVEPGTYELRAEHRGFKVAVQQGVVLAVGGSTTADVAMQIGSVSESVKVTAAEPLIEATSPNLSRVVEQQTIESLPILGRNFVDFAMLSSGIAPGRENEGGGAFKEPDTGVGQAAAPRLSFGCSAGTQHDDLGGRRGQCSDLYGLAARIAPFNNALPVPIHPSLLGALLVGV
jgi:Carboxypeptidase regulatory-like domain